MSLDERRATSLLQDKETEKRLEILLKEGDCYPTHVVIHPTMVCNHRCDFCNYFYTLDEHGEETGRVIQPTKAIEKKDIITFLEEFEACKVKNLVISGGGDPLLHKDIKEILSEALKFGYNKYLYTNLDFNLDQDILDILQKLSSVNVNINTIDRELYKKTRGRNANIERVNYNIAQLRDRSAILNAVVIVRDNTIDALESTLDGLDQQGFASIVISPAFDMNYFDNIKSSSQTIESLVKMKEKVKKNAKIRIVRPVEDAATLDGDVYCRTHYVDITIGADYGVYPCCMTAYKEGHELVNLKKFGSFVKGWSSLERRKKIENLGFTCKTCWFGSANNKLLEMGLR